MSPPLSTLPDQAPLTRQTPVNRQAKRDHSVLNGWRTDPRMVFLANPFELQPDGTRISRDLTAKERKEWERRIGQYQIRYERLEKA